MSEPKPTAFSRGIDAEEAAARLLVHQGFNILARRVRTPRGEIDLVARREGLLLFVEVKARSGLRAAAESLLIRQRRRIAAAAEIYLAAHPELAGLDMRLDVVLLAPGRAPMHLPGAFEAD
ncbi:putative endonuclease [Ancylobacter sp. 3268]|uniref:YraN family protein n=1 Tax=Ancylobacter sp. 3268 TaxID=2817752 RepID=UPI00285DF1C0|nr:YraN family protein [Ancylobacter sp. 3268]MDR6952614.1 putative endonuclease [Ancylobacter sp. 3268]